MRQMMLAAMAWLAWFTVPGAEALQVDTVNARFTLKGDNFIPIMVWVQPPGQFAFWKSMGVNTTINVESSQQTWLDGLVTHGLYGIPSRGQTGALNDNVIAYLIGDEPDIEEGGVMPRHDTTTVAGWAATMRTQRPGYPLFINFAGGFILYHSIGEANYRAWSRVADLVAFDIYPINQYQNPDNIYELASAATRLVRYVDNRKPVGSFIETGVIREGRNPTAGEIRAETWLSIASGCKFIAYFPCSFVPSFNYNNLPGNTVLENEIKRNNALITQLTDIILEPVVALTGFKRTFLTNSIQMQMYYRRHADDLYMFMISSRAAATQYQLEFPNAQGTDVEVIAESRTLTYQNGGIIDDFTTTESVHIYRVADYFAHNTFITYNGGFTRERSVWATGNGPEPTVCFELCGKARVRLGVYDATGRQVSLVADRVLGRGTYEYPVGPSNGTGVRVVRLSIGETEHLLPMVLLR